MANMSHQIRGEAAKVLNIAIAIRDAIKEAGDQGIPSGIIYAMLLDKMSLETYQGVINALVASGKVKIQGHVLRYVENVS